MQFFKYLSLVGSLVLIIISSAWVAASNESVVYFFSQLNEYIKEGADTEKAAREAMWKDAPETLASTQQRIKPNTHIETTRNVQLYEPHKTSDGLTFYVDYENNARLINMKGEEVYSWYKSFSQIWPEPDHVDKEFFGEDIAGLSEGQLLPNGDILVLYSRPGITPWGGGLARIDKDSNLVWKFNRKVHHWLDVSDDGRVFVLEHRIIKNKNDLIPDFYTVPYLQDSLFVLDLETGEKIKRIPLVNAILHSKYSKILEAGSKTYTKGDVLHANDVDYITKEMAEKLPFAKEGQVLISLHRLSTIAVLDIDTETIVWAQSGMWYGQHDPDFLANGNVSLIQNHANNIDNRILVDKLEGKITQIMQYNPLTKEIAWEYHGSDDNPLYTSVRGEVFPLPNGNILFTEHDKARILEITPDKEVVWEYINYNSTRGNQISAINGTARFKEADLPFLKEVKKQ